MRKLQTVVLPILILGGLIIFTIENWSPSVPLVLFGAKTIALPLSLWVMIACLSGALTTVAIALCLRVLTRTSQPFSPDNVQTFRSPPPRPPSTDERASDEYTQPSSASRASASRFDPSRVDSRSAKREQATQSSPMPPSAQSSSDQAPNVNLGLEDWEEFSRPREDWEDWQRSTPIVTEVDVDAPSPGSRFETTAQNKSSPESSPPTSYNRESSIGKEYGEYGDRQEEYVQESAKRDGDNRGPYDRRTYAPEDYEQPGYGRDREGYAREDYAEDYPPNDYAPDDYRDGYRSEQYAQDRYEYSNDEQERYSQGYSQAGYAGDRYASNRDERYRQDRDEYDNSYAGEDYYADDEYGPPNEYDQPYASPTNPSASSEQYIMDYGDEEALEAFDAELDKRTQHKTQSDSSNSNAPRTGRYRWKNPFNRQPRKDYSPQDDDLDLSSLDDWEE